MFKLASFELGGRDFRVEQRVGKVVVNGDPCNSFLDVPDAVLLVSSEADPVDLACEVARSVLIASTTATTGPP